MGRYFEKHNRFYRKTGAALLKLVRQNKHNLADGYNKMQLKANILCQVQGELWDVTIINPKAKEKVFLSF